MKVSLALLSVFVFIFLFTNCNGQATKQARVRLPAVSGSFYPANAQELKAQIASFFDRILDKKTDPDIAAVIVPHAGYIFSGEVAATAYARLDPDKTWEHIFLIGSSHYESLNGASIYNLGDFQTPLGVVKVDTHLANKLINGHKVFKSVPSSHEREHSLEVQLPFLQYRLNKPFKIVPVIIGTQSAETCKNIADALKPYFNSQNLFIISTDFSHYPAYADAVKYDRITGDAIASNNPALFVNTLLQNDKKGITGLATSCCGWSSVLTFLNITSNVPGVKIEHVKYMNSGDTSYGDKNRVVGYHSFIITIGNKETTGFNLSQPDGQLLLRTARDAIETRLKNKPLPVYSGPQLTKDIKIPCGAFVTLAKTGIYIIKGTQSGTFLPIVARETGWNTEELLGHCARDKAGIGWDGWKHADLYTFEALEFNEKETINSGR